MNKPWWKSGAIKGAIVVAGAVLASPQVLALIPSKWAGVIAAIGFVYNQAAQRSAIAKNGNGE